MVERGKKGEGRNTKSIHFQFNSMRSEKRKAKRGRGQRKRGKGDMVK